jgi:hypothetical protein
MSKDSFEDRLKRISNRHGIPEQQPPMPGGDFGPSPRRRHRRRGGGGGIMLVVGLAGLLTFGGAAMLVMGLTNSITSTIGVATGTHTPVMDGPARAKEPGLIDKLLASFRGKGSALPIDALPAAPQGWLRATTADAEQGDLVARMTAGWPRNPAGVSRPIEQNMGYKRLQRFATLYATSSIETRVKAKSRAVAVYMAASGEFLNVAMRYRSKRNALGADINPVVWGHTLEAIARDKLENDEIIERTSLAGHEVINRTQPAGRNPIARPIEQSRRQPTGMKVMVPLTSRAFIEI